MRLDTGIGSVTLRGREGLDEVSVHRRITYHGDKPGGVTHRIDGGRLTLGGCGDDCEVDYTVEVPSGVAVDGGATTGDLSLSDVGPVDLKTDAGNVTLEGVAAEVKVRTSNGNINGKDLRGNRIDAQTSNGEIDLTPGKPQDIRAETDNGELALTLPDSSYQLLVKTGNGDKDIRVRNEPSGDYRIELTTGNGDISVNPA
ncbi:MULTISPECIES: DUF4097 family beta strand repeat-containing protein [unclassified Streptomyces]|uniref:DUF4097 family beta strand repeat-containing protein n=1 Tax=unclassified Streptomyces TaxID=2593676 RepID=UPI002966FC76|nr:DUF4097 family beta strand repeat-containing protein [Streptomyces sp. SJL17-1]